MSDGVTLWRVSNYATLDGVGGTYVAGRWHTKAILLSIAVRTLLRLCWKL